MKITGYILLILLTFLSACSEDPIANEPVFMERFQNGRFPVKDFDGILNDTYIDSWRPDRCYSGNEYYLQLSTRSSYQSEMRILMDFKLYGYLPEIIKIKSAYLTLYRDTGAHAINGALEAYELTHTWNTNVTWDHSGDLTWSGGEFDSSNPIGNAEVTATQTISIKLEPKTVQSWFTTPGSFHGILIKFSESTPGGKIIQCRPSEYSDVSLRPMLTVYYTL